MVFIIMIKFKIVMTEELTRKFLVGVSVTNAGRLSLTRAEMWLDMVMVLILCILLMLLEKQYCSCVPTRWVCYYV